MAKDCRSKCEMHNWLNLLTWPLAYRPIRVGLSAPYLVRFRSSSLHVGHGDLFPLRPFLGITTDQLIIDCYTTTTTMTWHLREVPELTESCELDFFDDVRLRHYVVQLLILLVPKFYRRFFFLREMINFTNIYFLKYFKCILRYHPNSLTVPIYAFTSKCKYNKPRSYF